jgi:hypothetical protein
MIAHSLSDEAFRSNFSEASICKEIARPIDVSSPEPDRSIVCVDPSVQFHFDFTVIAFYRYGKTVNRPVKLWT